MKAHLHYAGDIFCHWASWEHGIDLLGGLYQLIIFPDTLHELCKTVSFVFLNKEDISVLHLVLKSRPCEFKTTLVYKASPGQTELLYRETLCRNTTTNNKKFPFFDPGFISCTYYAVIIIRTHSGNSWIIISNIISAI